MSEPPGAPAADAPGSGAPAFGAVAPGVVRPVGDAAVLLATAGPREAAGAAAALAELEVPGVLDAVAGLTSVLVTLEAQADLEVVAGVLGRLEHHPPDVGRRPTIVIPTDFDGPDLGEAAAAVGLRAADFVSLLCRSVLEVAMVGFSPGFAYLSGLPHPLDRVPRRAVPRTAVPAGSVAVAGGFAGVYPQATPGGWQLVGRSSVTLFDPEVPPYALLSPGDTVRFEALDPVDRVARPPEGRSAEGVSHPPTRPRLVVPAGLPVGFVVDQPGVFSTVQDAGRPGAAHFGVPAAGPADPLTHELANRLVGNEATAAAIEVTARGPVLEWRTPGFVAVVGDAVVTLDGHEVATGRVIPVTAGQRLDVGRVRSGLRATVAVAGGVVVPAVLGSRATDTLSWVGPGPLAAGDEVGIGPAPGAMGDHLGAGAPTSSPDTAGPRVLRVLAGPHPEWFPSDALAVLEGMRFVVEGASDRVGTRLRPAAGGRGVARLPGELDSQAMVTGAVQVPPSGEAVILGPDHAVIGGYPVLAVVIGADLGVLGQCRPGDEVQLRAVSATEARAAHARLRRAVAAAIVGHYPVVPG